MNRNYPNGRLRRAVNRTIDIYYDLRTNAPSKIRRKNKSSPLLKKLDQFLVRKPPVEGLDPSLQGTFKVIQGLQKWFIANQIIQPDGGISACVSFEEKEPRAWGSYPEVTGYIIPTLFSIADLLDSKEAFDAAVKGTNFELTCQDEEGWFPGGFIGNLTGPSVFNSAQIINGLVACYHQTKDEKYIHSAKRAADWIVSKQTVQGSWAEGNYGGLARTYDTTIAWHILEVGEAFDIANYHDTANKQIDWALKQQKENGWFLNCDNTQERNWEPLTHTIGYTIQGLIECYKVLKREDALVAAVKAAQKLLHIFEIDHKPLNGRYDSNWKGTVSSTCLTGDAQIAICWLELYLLTGENAYLNAGLKMNDYLKVMQFQDIHPLVDGSIPSSDPMDGDYFPDVINSWGPKYFGESLVLEAIIKMKLMGEKA